MQNHIIKDGVTYRINGRSKITSGKNFGKTLYHLIDPNGRQYAAMAKGQLRSNAKLIPYREMVQIRCLSTPDAPWTGPTRLERSRALAAISQIEGEHAADPTRGCAGPHEIIPA